MTLFDLGFKESSLENLWKGVYISQGPSKKKSHTQRGLTEDCFMKGVLTEHG